MDPISENVGSDLVRHIEAAAMKCLLEWHEGMLISAVSGQVPDRRRILAGEIKRNLDALVKRSCEPLVVLKASGKLPDQLACRFQETLKSLVHELLAALDKAVESG